MHRDVPRAAFYLFAELDNIFYISFSFVHLGELGVFLECALERHREALAAKGYLFAYPVANAIGVAKRACHVAHDATRKHGAKGTDLGHFVAAIFLARILNHLVAAVVGKVHVDIGRRWALWV